MGKGSNRRPTLVPESEVAQNWELVFSRKTNSNTGTPADDPESLRLQREAKVRCQHEWILNTEARTRRCQKCQVELTETAFMVTRGDL